VIVLAIAVIAGAVWLVMVMARRSPAVSLAAKVALFIGFVMGGLYALLVWSDTLSKEPDFFDIPREMAWFFVTTLLLYAVLAFVISWPLIAAWRAVRDTRTSRSRKALYVIGAALVVVVAFPFVPGYVSEAIAGMQA
jgi:hypothetical protein